MSASTGTLSLMPVPAAPLRCCLLIVLAAACAVAGCRPAGPRVREAGVPLRVVATTGIVGDLARQIGGRDVRVEALMGPGVDPHLYKASEGDVLRMASADLVLYQGLHLEGRMADVFARMNELGWTTAAAAGSIPVRLLRHDPATPEAHDPHVWFDVALWRLAARAVADALARADPPAAAAYRHRADSLDARMALLDAWIRTRIATVAPERRVLVTAHDAFAYFGAAYGVRVQGLQGLSTTTEAGTADVQRLAARLADERIPAVFVESSVPRRTLDAVVEAARARGADVRIGGSLYSDALGGPGSGADTYDAMVRANVNTIVAALGGAPDVAPVSGAVVRPAAVSRDRP